ncbi:MAG: alpha-L-fucosidase, partial [Bacteroidales bacterium]
IQKEISPPQVFGPVPSEQQMAWHEMETNAFIHFTVNTFTDKEWGFGDESPDLFKPDNVNADQWVSILKKTGFKGVILTCKHHDGFCLWPTQYTDHSVKDSPFQGGEGDVVKAVSDACKKYGLKFGVYLSPWDRNRADYGQPSYIEYYRDQLKELFTNYGPVFEMWFDGANGGDGYYGGAREKRQIDRQTYYDWPATLDLVRGMQPQVLFFSDAGPDLRWCGNERGVMGETNWNSISVDTLYAGKSGISDLLNTGSENGNKWVPGEVDTSIRPGWFYHASEDSLVKTPEQLFDIYLSSVGHGSTLLLNIPPDRRGQFHENDVRALKGFKAMLDSVFTTDLALDANVKASEVRGKSPDFVAKLVADGDKETYWTTNDGTLTASIELDLGGAKTIRYVQLQEYIKLGQRIRAFTVEAWQDDAWKKVAAGTTIGYKRILKVDPFSTDKIKITITDSKACPVISSVSLF